MDAANYQDWIGRSETAEDIVTSAAVRALRATFDHEDVTVHEGDPLPPAWHWMFTNPIARQSQLGPEGHPERGTFFPPIELPRRMWAGSRLEFRAPLRVGERITRRSRIASIQPKTGSTGALVFVTVRHEITSGSGGCTIDEQNIVWREEAKGANPVSARREAPPGTSDFSRTVEPDPVMLFRFSALTFNGHRIHYDQPYVTQVEGYPGLVVHGPLVALFMLDLFTRHHPYAQIAGFEFSGKRPITLPTAMAAHCRREAGHYALWVEAEGAVASTGRLTLAGASKPEGAENP